MEEKLEELESTVWIHYVCVSIAILALVWYMARVDRRANKDNLQLWKTTVQNLSHTQNQFAVIKHHVGMDVLKQATSEDAGLVYMKALDKREKAIAAKLKMDKDLPVMDDTK